MITSQVISVEIIETIRKEVEDRLIEWRDGRLGILGRGNGLVIKEKDGTPSNVIRMGTPEVIHYAITRYLEITK